MTVAAALRASAQPSIPVPEPDLTPAVMLARAEAMIPALRAQRAEADAAGRYGEDIHRAFQQAGFYRVLQPRAFGGYAFGLTTFLKLVMTLGRGDPGAAWCFSLAATHVLAVASHLDADAQREIFGADGEFRAPHRAQPSGSAVAVDEGFRVSGVWEYCSGVPYATHFIGTTIDPRGTAEALRPPLVFVVPRAQFTIVDDWGGDRVLGMQASGSNSVRLDDVFVPENRTFAWDLDKRTLQEGTPGTALHGDPLYLGRLSPVYAASAAVVQVGLLRAALDEFEAIIRAKKTIFPPKTERFRHPDFQRPFGMALAAADSAEAIFVQMGEQYAGLGRRWADTGQPFTMPDEVRLAAMAMFAGRMAAEAVGPLFYASGTTSARKGEAFQRHFRDSAMYLGHTAAQLPNLAPGWARSYFGIGGMFG